MTSTVDSKSTKDEDNETIIFERTTTDDQARQILELQAKNHRSIVDEVVANEQGFVTLRHSFEVLSKMNRESPAIIATVNGKVVGYALVMPQRYVEFIPLLNDMFENLNKMEHNGVPLKGNARWFVMGQICVDVDFRGRGVVDGLYNHMKSKLKQDYDFVVTEISERNQRSIRAHERVGFQTMSTHDAPEDVWRIVVLDL